VTGTVRAMVASFLRSSAMAGAHGGGSPTTSGPLAPLRPPLASPRLQLRRVVAVRVQQVSSLVGKNPHHGVRYL
jgi:hypothetical protein